MMSEENNEIEKELTQEQLAAQKKEKEEQAAERKVQEEKAKMNLIYGAMLSVIMFFGGLTSAYIVSMGDAFWVKFPFPSAFWISTAIIAVSSLIFQYTVNQVKKGNTKFLKVGVISTFVLGLAFVYTQYKGYGQLAESGSHLTGSGIVVSDGRYGDYFAVKQDGEFVYVDGNDYLKQGKKLSTKEMESLQAYMKQFEVKDFNVPFKAKDDGIHTLYWEEQELDIVNGRFQTKDTINMQLTDRIRLYYLSINVKDGRGHFFMRGEFGKDFHIYYKGEEMGYEKGNLTFKGRKLDTYLQVKALESADTSSSFLWGITIAHLLHIIITLLYLTKLVIHSLSGKINAENNVSLRMGAVFWHFLGFLWLFLLLFLLFIH